LVVSILGIVSKILEKAIYKQAENRSWQNNMLYKLQFRVHTPLTLVKTETAKGLFTGMVLLDLQKAFDTISDEALLN
jgi:hypothetical protein